MYQMASRNLNHVLIKYFNFKINFLGNNIRSLDDTDRLQITDISFKTFFLKEYHCRNQVPFYSYVLQKIFTSDHYY